MKWHVNLKLISLSWLIFGWISVRRWWWWWWPCPMSIHQTHPLPIDNPLNRQSIEVRIRCLHAILFLFKFVHQLIDLVRRGRFLRHFSFTISFNSSRSARSATAVFLFANFRSTSRTRWVAFSIECFHVGIVGTPLSFSRRVSMKMPFV